MVSDDIDDGGQRPGPDPSDRDVELLRLINSLKGGFGTARDIVDYTNVGYKQTRNRLDDLVSDGYLLRRKVGTTKVYWLSSQGEERLESAEF